MPPQLRQIADFGTSEPWVARIEMTMLEFLSLIRVVPRGQDTAATEDQMAAYKQKQEKAKGQVMALAEELGQAFIDLRRLRVAGGAFSTQLETVKAYRDLYEHLWVSYKDRFQKLMQTLGFDVGFIFQKDEKLDQLAAVFLAAHPGVDPELIDRIREDKVGWHLALRTHRDDGEHNTDGPTLGDNPLHNLEGAEIIFSNTWHAMEDVFVCSMEEEFGNQLTIFEVPEAKRNPDAPKKYAVGLTVDTNTGQVMSR